MNDNDVLLVLITVPDRDTAERIAELLVTKQLAACINIIPNVTSIYSWEGEMKRDDELLLIAKSTKPLFTELKSAVIAAHPYSMPEVITVDVTNGSGSYLDWVIKSVKRSSDL